MQRPNEKKRKLIADIAARMFATRPFHEVRLDDVAAAAKVGKGTVYVYFDSKEDLYFSLLADGFSSLIEGLKAKLDSDTASSRDSLRVVLRELVQFAVSNPHLFELMRATGGQLKTNDKWAANRRELAALIQRVIRRGVRDGVFCDPNPDITALCVPGLVRSVYLYSNPTKSPEEIADHLIRILERGIVSK